MENTTTNQTGTRQTGVKTTAGRPHIESAYCPICTHTVPAEVIWKGKRMFVKPGQKCARCHSQLDAGYIIRTDQAA
jgi:hypothetical protein